MFFGFNCSIHPYIPIRGVWGWAEVVSVLEKLMISLLSSHSSNEPTAMQIPITFSRTCEHDRNLGITKFKENMPWPGPLHLR